MKPQIVNFCTTVRNAITALGCSHEQAKNVCNSKLGDMELVKKGEDKTKAMTIKRPKADGSIWTASNTVTPGSEKYQTTDVGAEHLLKEWNDIQTKAEVSFPSQVLTIPADSAMGKWLLRYAPGKKAEKAEPVVPASK